MIKLNQILVNSRNQRYARSVSAESCLLGMTFEGDSETHVSPTAVVLAALDLVERGIREVELLRPVVYGQAVGGSDVRADDHEDVGATQSGAHDAGRLLVPVGPKHQAAGRHEQVLFEETDR